jgi:hypothetical protein
VAHPDNRFYGHNAALAAYVGVAGAPPVIRGHVQHGWMLGTGVLAVGREVPWLPKLVWSAQNVAAARAEGHRHVEPMGAPFLYLLEAMGVDTHSDRDGVGTLVYPHHSWEGDHLDAEHDRYVAEISEREGDTTTICLYWREYEDPKVRARYERAGFPVVCHGRREDPGFLRRVVAAMTEHRRVVSNRVGSALWYAAALGRDVEVYGPVFVSQETEAEALAFDREARTRWSGLYDGGIAGADAVAIGRAELGAENVMEPDELVSFLGWDRPRWQGAVLRAAVHAEHRARGGLMAVRSSARST